LHVEVELMCGGALTTLTEGGRPTSGWEMAGQALEAPP
jgi:hypothetical protein